MAKRAEHEKIWNSVSRALGTELKHNRTIKGISGIEHPVQAVSVDEDGQRVLVVSSEVNPRTAALVQVDVQAAMPSSRIIVARPVLFDMPEMTRRIATRLAVGDLSITKVIELLSGSSEGDQGKFLAEQITPVLEPLMKAAIKLNLPGRAQAMGVLQQIVNLNWEDLNNKENKTESFINMIMSNLSQDSKRQDTELGICPFPLYELSEGDWELFLSGRRIGEIRERLKQVGIYQYFFPPADHLILGLADEHSSKDRNIIAAVEKAPEMGHPLGENEIIPRATNVAEMIDALKDKGYVAEAEIGLTITENGKEIRHEVKIRPREGFIQKLSRVISVKAEFNSKDFFR